jgi:hypothetical protein
MKFNFFNAQKSQHSLQEARESFLQNGYIVAENVFSAESLSATIPYIVSVPKVGFSANSKIGGAGQKLLHAFGVSLE